MLDLNYQSAIVINGHGTKTDQFFTIQNNTVLTPEDLTVPYVFSIDPNYHLEKLLRDGFVKPTQQGQWQVYAPFSCIPDVRIDPWHQSEAFQFASRLLNDSQLWSALDNENGLLYKRDPQSVLVVKAKEGYRYLQGEALKTYLEAFMQHYPNSTEDTPIAFITPKIGKVKIVNQTSLSEIIKVYTAFYGAEKFLLATCNAKDHQSKVVHLDTSKPNIPIEQLYPKKTICFQSKNVSVSEQEPKTQGKYSYALR